MDVVVREVESRRDVRRWIGFPYSLYDRGQYPQWVPPLRISTRDAIDRKRNPFYEQADRALFLAERAGRVVGRIAAIENRAHTRFHDDRVGFFGFFECVDDQDTARALFAAAAAWLASRGLTSMRGPMNPSTNYECGLLVDGFEERPTFMTSWNPPYYDALCTNAGLAQSKDLLAFWFSYKLHEYRMPGFIFRLAERAVNKGRVVFRNMDPSRSDAEAEACWEIYNSAWEANWGFIPLSRGEFLHMAREMKQLADQRFAYMAEVDGKPAGFMLALPDYNDILQHNRSGRLLPFGAIRLWLGKGRPMRLRVMALGVKPEYRSRSILALFTQEIYLRGQRAGGSGAEASWLLEDNVKIVKPMRDMGARESKRWRVYEAAVAAIGGPLPLERPSS